MALHSQYKLVICVALEQECPDVYLYPCIDKSSLKALLAGDTRSFTKESTVLLIIMGVGKDNAYQTAQWINHHLNPLLVWNIGSAAVSKPEIELNSLIVPQYLNSNNQDESMPIWDRIPFFHHIPHTNVCHCHSLSSPNELPPENADIIDMEAAFLADSFKDADIAFTCLKYTTDRNDSNKEKQFQANLELCRSRFQALFDALFKLLEIKGVSVVIPIYNRSEFIEKSVHSVLYQTNIDIDVECLVVDDGSTDNTKEVLRNFNENIKLLSHKSNKGVSAARNLGIQNATYDWICFLDSDDIWEAEKLSAQINYLKVHPYLSVIQSDESWRRKGEIITKPKQWRKKEGYIWPESLLRCTISPSSVMIRKSVLNYYDCFDESFVACEDYELWLKLTRNLLVGLVDKAHIQKIAGHSDQLSVITPVLDQYRIRALSKQLDIERHAEFKAKLQQCHDTKVKIVENGAKKRGIS